VGLKELGGENKEGVEMSGIIICICILHLKNYY
jgi:hypothetical protein